MKQQLLDTARYLANRSRRRPQQADLRRAVSTAYYAIFHALAECCANMLVGGPSAQRGERAWTQVYRSLQHAHARKACKTAAEKDFPAGVKEFARSFTTLQEERHAADYNPTLRLKREDANQLIALAAEAIDDLDNEANKHKRAFAVYVLFPTRKNQ